MNWIRIMFVLLLKNQHNAFTLYLIGGKGNYFFLSNENRAPTTYELGGKGEMKQIMLELRVMAQVGLVCF